MVINSMDRINMFFDDDHCKALGKEIYVDNDDRLSRLTELHFQKTNLKLLRDEVKNSWGGGLQPFTIEFSGSPRAGKTSCINRVYDFFKKAGFKIALLQEPAGQINARIKDQSELMKMDKIEFNNLTLQISREMLAEARQDDNDIILMDRGVLDNYIWYNMFYKNGLLSNEDYRRYINQLLQLNGEVDQLIITLCEAREAVKRDYLNSITLEPRRKVTTSRITEFNDSTVELGTLFKKLVDDYYIIDTTHISEIDTSILVAGKIIDSYQKKLNMQVK